MYFFTWLSWIKCNFINVNIKILCYAERKKKWRKTQISLLGEGVSKKGGSPKRGVILKRREVKSCYHLCLCLHILHHHLSRRQQGIVSLWVFNILFYSQFLASLCDFYDSNLYITIHCTKLCIESDFGLLSQILFFSINSAICFRMECII